MSRPPAPPPVITSAPLSTPPAYVPPFDPRPGEFMLDLQPSRQTQPGSPTQPQQQQSSPPNPRKRKAPESSPMAGMPSVLDPGYGPSSGYAAQAQQGEQESEAPPIQPSVPKKSRTNTPWTPAEEQRLKTMRDAGNSWSEIAKDMHYADFAEDESAALLAAIKDYEASKWKVIGAKVGKPAKYAKEHFGGRI
ncbi:MAG: hypothetical protein LQ337_005550 [Flavoplaca oasis]|nr:MAG: hypothetical protein LQ337_005550 [Flavoplaca oasis]